MERKKKTRAEVLAEVRRELEEWPEHRAQMEAMYARFLDRWRTADEREQRRRQRLRRISFGLLGR